MKLFPDLKPLKYFSLKLKLIRSEESAIYCLLYKCVTMCYVFKMFLYL